MREIFRFKTMVIEIHNDTIVFVTLIGSPGLIVLWMYMHVHAKFSIGNIQGWDIGLQFICMYIFLQQLIIIRYQKVTTHAPTQ